MDHTLQLWDVYEITTQSSAINGVMLRGRIRKLGIDNGFNVLAENTSDKENGVRFAVLNKNDAETVTSYIHDILNDADVKLVMKSIANPVLSKLKVNIESRYKI
jgi:hypothetical protein